MADQLRLSLADHAMIHALGVLSRPPITDRSDLDLVVGILRDLMPGVTRENPQLMGLIQTADQFLSCRVSVPGCYGGLHDRARKVMNEWDRRRLADAWDRARGAK
ncbi:hypothetical protein BDE18_0393 [Paracoccus pantotrophus]|uniref:Uncharacterized protein n=2 Tax=Paracoccus pantotrophus TaxID=82367 RepID=A0ABX9SB13_PARPN|nr:hypothetical protein [Paracoccus pantotrophus]RKS51162.1 hypothetical protein BDE18_0393 [Paracoccus pantotrophus]